MTADWPPHAEVPTPWTVRGGQGGGSRGWGRWGAGAQAEGGLGPPSPPPSVRDKQKLKPTEIISRSWFPRPPGASTSSSSSKASSVLEETGSRTAEPPHQLPRHSWGTGNAQAAVSWRSQRALSTTKPSSLGSHRCQRGQPEQACIPETAPLETAETPKNSRPLRQEESCQDRPQPPPDTSPEAANLRTHHSLCSLSSSLVADYLVPRVSDATVHTTQRPRLTQEAPPRLWPHPGCSLTRPTSSGELSPHPCAHLTFSW